MLSVAYNPFDGLDPWKMLGAMVDAARVKLANYKTYRLLSEADSILGDQNRAIMNAELAHGAVIASRTIGHAIREVIISRTRYEQEAATLAVLNGQAAFLTPACATDSCDQCERPLWQHISIAGGIVLCPFGRQYWQHARAILAHGGNSGWECASAFLADIARETAP